MTADEWRKAEKKTDPNFKGSIFDQIGNFTDKLCPTCSAHLSTSGICLNACHLGTVKAERFGREMEGFAKR